MLNRQFGSHPDGINSTRRANVTTDYQFGKFLVEPSQNQISTPGYLRKLEPRTMDVLVYLVEHRDRVVSSEELLEKLWPGRIVEESTIHRRINQLRKALEDSAAESRYIKTVVKRGYQSVAELSVLNSDDSRPTAQPSVEWWNKPSMIVSGALAISFFV
ncbi:MAG: transcriptional regulator, partial [Pseudomonadales bacterium]